MTADTASDTTQVGVRAARVEATRSVILDAAERLFAEQRVMSVSNRQISDAAGQGNNTAVGYHFGTKVDLVKAVVSRHKTDIDARRDAMVRSDSIRDWVNCLVRPTADHLASASTPTYFARFSAQLPADPELRNVIVADVARTGPLRVLLENLDRCRPELPPAVRAEREVMSSQLILGSAGRCNTTVNRSAADGIQAGTPRSRGAVLGAIETGPRTNGGL